MEDVDVVEDAEVDATIGDEEITPRTNMLQPHQLDPQLPIRATFLRPQLQRRANSVAVTNQIQPSTSTIGICVATVAETYPSGTPVPPVPTNTIILIIMMPLPAIMLSSTWLLDGQSPRRACTRSTYQPILSPTKLDREGQISSI